MRGVSPRTAAGIESKPHLVSSGKGEATPARWPAPEFGAELARVADRAAARIRRLHGGSSPRPGYTKAVHANLGDASHGYARLGYTGKDALQEVRFDAFEMAQAHGLARSAMYARYIRREPADMRPSTGPSLGFSQPQLQSGTGTPTHPRCKKCSSSMKSAQPAKPKPQRES